MRISTLRTLAVFSLFLLLDFSFPELLFIGYDIFPDVIGLVFVLGCSVLLIEKAATFTRPVVVCLAMLFLETVRIFHLVDDPMIVQLLLLVYLFLKALLIMLVLEAEGQACRNHDDIETGALAERIALLYALTFPLRMGEMFLPEWKGIFWLSGLSISVLTFIILFYIYTRIALPLEEGVNDSDVLVSNVPEDADLDEDEEEKSEEDDTEDFYNRVFSRDSED